MTIEAILGAIGGLVIIIMLFLGVIGPGWEGTKKDRTLFWFVFLPCLIFLVLTAFWLGKILN